LLLGFKTELKVNNKQKTLLAKHAGVARHAYNWGLGLTKQILDYNKENPDEKIKFPTAIDLHKWLVALVKPEYPWYYEVSKCAPQYALKALRDAWGRCFNKIGKAPRFKKKGKKDKFTLDGSISIEPFQIRVPIIGWLKTYERLPTGIVPKSVTISRQADSWFISFKIEAEPMLTPKIHDVVGVDLGVLHLATLSTGEVFEGAKSYRKYENYSNNINLRRNREEGVGSSKLFPSPYSLLPKLKKLARLQWLNRHKVLRSNNWRKVQIKIARLQKLIADIRKDTLHKITTYLAKNHSKIGIEDLNVSGMLANHKLAKAIADMGFYEFRRQLEYKCKLYGSELIIIDRWFPSSKTCSGCGVIKEKLFLSERIFNCECGLNIDRDLNAAINLSKAVSSTVSI